MPERWRGIGIALTLIIVLLLLVFFSLVLLGPQIGNVFSDITNNLGGSDSRQTEIANQPTQVPRTNEPSTEVADDPTATDFAQVAGLTDTPSFEQTLNPTPSQESIDISAVQLTATALAQIFDSTPTADAIVPTLSTAQYGTAVANLATAQTSPTAVPTVSNTANNTIAGNGDVRPYYNTELAYPNTMRVTLELVFRELAIAPTPLQELLIVSVNEDIENADPVPEGTQEIPPPARANERVENIPLYVVAELDCLESSFHGCERRLFTHLSLMGLNSWNWTIQPVEGISGNQDLTLLLYSADEDGNIINTRPLYEHSFSINVRDKGIWGVLMDNLWAVILALAIIIFGGMGYLTFGRRDNKAKSIGVSAFISYKRKGSWGIAEKVHDGLTSRGVDAFIDSQDLHEGDFETRLTNEIRNRDYVVVVLVQETLQSAWVIKEIAFAFELGKTVIPVLIEGVKMEDLNIPDEIADLKKQNAVSLYQKYFDAGMDEVLVFLKPLQ